MEWRTSKVNCSVVGCYNTYINTVNVKFFRFPVRKHQEKQRNLWIAAIKRINEDGSLWKPTTHSRICSAHFLGNKPSNVPDNPAYVPTIFPKVNQKTKKSSKKRKARKIPTLMEIMIPEVIKEEKEIPVPKFNLKRCAMPTLNLSKTLNQEEIELETSENGNFRISTQCNASWNSPKKKNDVGTQGKGTKSVSIQCNISGPFVNNDLNHFFYDNFSIIEKYVIEQMNMEKMSNLEIEDEVLAEINDEGCQKDTTCDIPDDDLFFNEVLLKEKNALFDLEFHCCEHCGLTFSDIRSYRDHEGVHAEISLLCCYCGEVSADYMKNIEHEYRCRKIKQIENGEISPPKKKKRSRKVLTNYCLPESIFCPIENEQLDVNDSEIKKNELVGYFCSVCQELFNSQELCQNHLKQHDFGETPIADFDMLETPISINREYKISGDTTIEFLKNPAEEYSCQICGRVYATEYLLNRHVDVKHLNPIQKLPKFQCTECDMTFRNFIKLRAHVKEHVISLKHCKICSIVHDDNQKYLKHLQNSQHLILEEKWKNRYKINLFACYLCKTEQTEYSELVGLAEHSDYHRISKTRTFINSLLAEYEINHFKL